MKTDFRIPRSAGVSPGHLACLLILLIGFLVLPSIAQENQKGPGAEQKLLHVWVGKWDVAESYVESPFGPAEKATYQATGRMINGGFQVQTVGKGKTPSGPVSWTEISYYDQSRKMYRTFYCDSTGLASDSEVVVNGNVRTSAWEASAAGVVYKCRSTASFSQDGRSYQYRWEYSKDGADWKPWLTGVAKKTGK